MKTIRIIAPVRYWEDIEINGVQGDEDGTNVPCKVGNEWCPLIDIATGIIQNWEQGKTAKVHFKVCDECGWEIYDNNGCLISHVEDEYVPDTFSPGGEGYGDYIIMKIDENGKIENWHFHLDDFNLSDN